MCNFLSITIHLAAKDNFAVFSPLNNIFGGKIHQRKENQYYASAFNRAAQQKEKWENLDGTRFMPSKHKNLGPSEAIYESKVKFHKTFKKREPVKNTD